MRKVTFAINMTADGYCHHEYGISDEETYGFFIRILKSASVLLVGRVTYQLMVPFWPDVAKSEGTGPMHQFARAFDAVDKVVFSNSLKQVAGNATLTRADVADEVAALKNQPGKDIFIDSLSLASRLSDLGMIDEYHIFIHPVLSGKGPRFFETVNPGMLSLDLVESKTLASGIVILHYKKHM